MSSYFIGSTPLGALPNKSHSNGVLRLATSLSGQSEQGNKGLLYFETSGAPSASKRECKYTEVTFRETRRKEGHCSSIINWAGGGTPDFTGMQPPSTAMFRMPGNVPELCAKVNGFILHAKRSLQTPVSERAFSKHCSTIPALLLTQFPCSCLKGERRDSFALNGTGRAQVCSVSQGKARGEAEGTSRYPIAFPTNTEMLWSLAGEESTLYACRGTVYHLYRFTHART